MDAREREREEKDRCAEAFKRHNRMMPSSLLKLVCSLYTDISLSLALILLLYGWLFMIGVKQIFANYYSATSSVRIWMYDRRVRVWRHTRAFFFFLFQISRSIFISLTFLFSFSVSLSWVVFINSVGFSLGCNFAVSRKLFVLEREIKRERWILHLLW